MQEVEAVLANVPVADTGRIAEIKQAIAEGRFKVDASKVADGLIENVRQMIAAQARRA
jgi:negative regulator of flagellin synthesis FlgM